MKNNGVIKSNEKLYSRVFLCDKKKASYVYLQ